jgi:hypothetical protein
MVQSGQNPLPTIKFPAFHTVIGKELGKRGELPPVISVPGAAGSWDKAGFLGTQYNAFDVGSPNTENYKVRDLDLPMGVDWSRMDRRQSLLALVDEKFRRLDTSGILDNMDAYYKMAFQLMHSEKAKKAFRIEEEPEVLRDQYGRTSLGQGSLLARRLIEAGARFVTVSSGNWDHHRDIFPALKNDFLPELDRAFSALLEDLEQRGLLDSTLVIVSSEFGRTPEINHMAGRDHWPSCFSVVLAGAGITGGRVWGSSDEKGMFVKDNPVQVPDLIASVYKKLGIDYQKQYISNIGRPVQAHRRWQAAGIPDGVGRGRLRTVLKEGFQSIDYRLQKHGPLEPDRFSLLEADTRWSEWGKGGRWFAGASVWRWSAWLATVANHVTR